MVAQHSISTRAFKASPVPANALRAGLWSGKYLTYSALISAHSSISAGRGHTIGTQTPDNNHVFVLLSHNPCHQIEGNPHFESNYIRLKNKRQKEKLSDFSLYILLHLL